MIRMSPRASGALVAFLFLVLPAIPARGDVVKTAGVTYEGRIVFENDVEVKIELSKGGAITIPKKDVLAIERKKSNLDLLEEKLAALHPSRPGEYVDTGKWILEEVKREELGLRTITTGMALDAGAYVKGALVLGDYHQKKREKSEKGRAAYWYVRALLAAPRDPVCNQKFDSVKDATDLLGGLDDRMLLEGLQAYRRGDNAEAIEKLGTGRRSGLRAQVEEQLNQKIDSMISYCQTRVPCRTCKGAKALACPSCKGTGSISCKTCNGDGQRKQTSASGTTSVACGDCSGKGKTSCKKCTGSKGGQIKCPTCKGLSTASNPLATTPVSSSLVDQAASFLQRRMGGVQTVAEQAQTRMLRVGNALPLDGAEELVAYPVWTGERWGPAEKVTPADPEVQRKELATAEANEAIRKKAETFQPDAGDAEAFLARVRGTFGVGPTSAAVGQQVRCTEFGTRTPAPGEAATLGSHVEIDAASGTLRPVLVQVSDTWSITRVTLADVGADAVALPAVPELARTASTAGSVVRIYYTVVDAREDVLPQPERDVCLHALSVKCLLIDLLDADGRVVRSVR